jgi:hypothetical protein
MKIACVPAWTAGAALTYVFAPRTDIHEEGSAKKPSNRQDSETDQKTTVFPGQSRSEPIRRPGRSVLRLGNQPRMKAAAKSAAANKLNFEFAGGGNLDPKTAKHMHAATLTIVDADHIEIEGIGWENGAPAKEMCNGMKLVRKK